MTRNGLLKLKPWQSRIWNTGQELHRYCLVLFCFVVSCFVLKDSNNKDTSSYLLCSSDTSSNSRSLSTSAAWHRDLLSCTWDLNNCTSSLLTSDKSKKGLNGWAKCNMLETLIKCDSNVISKQAIVYHSNWVDLTYTRTPTKLKVYQFPTVSRFSVSFDCFWDVNITTYWRLKSEPVIGWKFRAVFVRLLPFKTEIQSFSSKSGQKCKLLCRLKDKGKRYSTLESMLSKKKRQGKTRIKTCFHLFLTVCFCRGVVVRALIT